MDRVSGFLQTELTGRSRIALVVAALVLIPSIFLPVWTITLEAPQYPGGLDVVIYPHTVGGELTEVNLLNHYIGMHEISADEFPEFIFIPFFILRFAAFGILAALIGRMTFAVIGYMDFVVFGAVMLYVFQHWLTDFGTNLSPNAPINLEPFSPSFLGTTTVAQFSVSSWPAVGGVLMLVAGLLGPLILVLEWRRYVTEPSGSGTG
ncbi:MAG: hypothetical protein R3195_03530 [Gemmatimonadota bacterium]|nr:hypothetical protein [Gemmatimonadota bacterium]